MAVDNDSADAASSFDVKESCKRILSAPVMETPSKGKTLGRNHYTTDSLSPSQTENEQGEWRKLWIWTRKIKSVKI